MADGKDQAQTLQAKLNDPDISKREVKQISKQADKAMVIINDDHIKLISQRDALLSNDNSQTNDFPSKTLSQEVVQDIDKQLSTSELPQPNLNF